MLMMKKLSHVLSKALPMFMTAMILTGICKSSAGQALNGLYTINNTVGASSTNFISFGTAFAALNSFGIAGPVTFDVPAGLLFNEQMLTLSATGTNSRPVIFRKSGAGSNPTIQGIGTSQQSTSIPTQNDWIIRLFGCDYITFDGLNFEASGSGNATNLEFAIFFETGSNDNGCQYNTIRSCNMSMSNNGNFGQYTRGVRFSSLNAVTTAGSNSYNKFINNTVRDAFTGYEITSGQTQPMDIENFIGTEGNGTSEIVDFGRGAGATAYAVYMAYQQSFRIENTAIYNTGPYPMVVSAIYIGGTAATNTGEISGNLIRDLHSTVTSAATTILGINVSTASAVNITGNRLHTFNSAGNTGLFGTGNAFMRAISVTAANSTIRISDNAIHDIKMTGTQGQLSGVYASHPSMRCTIERNKIFRIETTGGQGRALGLELRDAVYYDIFNNMISDLRGGTSWILPAVAGIRLWGGSINNTNHTRIYHNTIYINDIVTNSSYENAVIYNIAWASVLDMRNNIFINKTDVSGAKRASIFHTPTLNLSDIGFIHPSSNNNLYYCGTPSAKNLIAYIGTISYPDIQSYQALFATYGSREILSVSDDVVFDPSMMGLGEMRPVLTQPSFVESRGQIIPNLITDFDNDPRGPYPITIPPPVNGGGTAPDLGADEADMTKKLMPGVPGCVTLIWPPDNAPNICPLQQLAWQWNPSNGVPATGGFNIHLGKVNPPPLNVNISASGNMTYLTGALDTNETYYWQIVPVGDGGPAVNCPVYSFSTTNLFMTSVSGDTLCKPGIVNLMASGSNLLNWYNTPVGGSPVFTGSLYPPFVNSTTTFYVGSALNQMLQTGKPALISGTSLNNTIAGIIFSTYAPVILDSVHVYPIGTGSSNVTIALREYASGPVLNQAYVNVTGTPAPGVKTAVALNFLIQPGRNYMLSYEMGPGLTGFMREPVGGFPYTTANGSVKLTGSQDINMGFPDTSRYYYFYDWRVRQVCESWRLPVTAVVMPRPDSSIVPGGPTTINQGQSVTLTGVTGYTYSWSTGETTQFITVMPNITTTYTVTVTDGFGCFSTSQITITVVPPVGGEVIQQHPGIKLFPNPSGANTSLLVSGYRGPLTLTLTDVTGRIIRTDFAEVGNDLWQYSLPHSQTGPGICFLEVKTSEGSTILRWIRMDSK
jgi:hypothetical protein